MHGLFGFDPKNLSDDELLDRVVELNRRIAWSAKFGSGEMLAALQSQRQAIEFEQRERLLAPYMAARLASPSVVVETDPDLAQEAKAAREAEAAKNSPKNKPRPKPFSISRDRIKPTARPASEE